MDPKQTNKQTNKDDEAWGGCIVCFDISICSTFEKMN